jgi:CRISPR-associated endonuclease Cas1
MNALWLNRIYTYKNSTQSVETVKKIIAIKIIRETLLIRRYKKYVALTSPANATTLNEILLIEARSAKQFWGVFAHIISPQYGFIGRKTGDSDIVNELLDIGFHHITQIVTKMLMQQNIPTEIGLLHTAHASNSSPLSYDLVELFRADLVGVELLRFLRLKKKPLHELSQKHIGHFLSAINKRMEHKYYLKEFRQCHTYKYYMELQILRFIKAVNHNQIFEPFTLPTRHDTRCTSLFTNKKLLTSFEDTV